MSEALELESVIGLAGDVNESLILHPDGRTLIYPLGSTVVIRNKDEVGSQQFLQGHSDKVTCVALSNSGRYLASGQVTFMGFKADIILWDLETREPVHRMSLQKVKIQALHFSPDDKYLASLGGEDDNSVVMWDVDSGEAICGSPTHANFTHCVKFLNCRNDVLVTAGAYNLHVWEYDKPNNKLRAADVQLGQLQRKFTCVAVDPSDRFIYCGTESGDVLQVSVQQKLFRNSGPLKGPIARGVTALAVAPTGDLLVGGGDGSVHMLRIPAEPGNPKANKKLASVAGAKLDGPVTTIAVEGNFDGKLFGLHLVTGASTMYRAIYDSQAGRFAETILQTAHARGIAGLAFPADYGEVFATAALNEIRVWHVGSCRELLRIKVPNLECLCLAFMPDGTSIVSGWSDGRVRGFGPQSGKLLWTIDQAHHQSVTAIAACADCEHIVSGGAEGMVRVWRILPGSQPMVASMKEHRAAVNHIAVKASTGDECVSASSDGSCIIWDLTSFKRRASLFANTFFKSVGYHADESQLVTVGTDRKLTYWDPFDGQPIRVLDASDSAEVCDLALDPAGEAVVTGGGDKAVKLWGYDEGHLYYVGIGHSGTVTHLAVSPCARRIVSVGTEGGIFVWKYVSPLSGGS